MRPRRLHGWQRLALLPVLLLALLMLVLAGSFAFGGTAHAQSGDTATATLTIASPVKLIARTTLQITGTASCTIPVGATLIESVGGSVTVTQASGRVLVQAGGGFILPTCDGTAQSFQVFATPPAGSAPFHGGPATASGSFFFSYIDALGNFIEAQVTTNPQTISISG